MSRGLLRIGGRGGGWRRDADIDFLAGLAAAGEAADEEEVGGAAEEEGVVAGGECGNRHRRVAVSVLLVGHPHHVVEAVVVLETCMCAARDEISS